jgi:hypothetical protein
MHHDESDIAALTLGAHHSQWRRPRPLFRDVHLSDPHRADRSARPEHNARGGRRFRLSPDWRVGPGPSARLPRPTRGLG